MAWQLAFGRVSIRCRQKNAFAGVQIILVFGTVYSKSFQISKVNGEMLGTTICEVICAFIVRRKCAAD